VRIAHLADIHLGFRQYHRQNPLGINQREADVANGFRAAVDAVLAARPDAVLLAGDLFHQVRPSNTAIVFAFQQFQRLRHDLPEAPIVVIAGNHDTPRSSETGSILRLYEEMGVDVALDRPRRFEYPSLDLSVLAVPHQPLREGERPVLRPAGSATRQVLLLHGEVEGIYPPHISGAAWGGVLVHPDEIHAEEWSYVALGHYHVQYQVARHVWYAGSLEYVTSNPWGELWDEGQKGIPGKGWLLVDLDRRKVTRQPAARARRVVSLPPIYADGLDAVEIDRLIRERLASIEGGWKDQIVRLVVFNIPRHVARELDHATIREVKASALHFHLDLRRPEVGPAGGVEPGARRKPLAEVLRDFLAHRPLPAELDREAFVTAGVGLLDAVIREEDA
jgi:DNA repair protein SbcD/Mre11